MEYSTLLTQVILVVSLLAFSVSVITQVIKGVSIFEKVPTDLLVFLLSIFLTVLFVVAYAQYKSVVLVWYMYVSAVLLGFFVAFVSMFGWEKFSSLWGRFKGPGMEE